MNAKIISFLILCAIKEILPLALNYKSAPASTSNPIATKSPERSPDEIGGVARTRSV
jgi:hypothetical protein